ncbi:MAG: TIGR03663 family protein [Phycisphaerae bacterium]|nr:TIGR03663 family protein [Phycisphaerae bacterium]
MNRRAAPLILLLAAAALGLALRAGRLNLRPMHGDEAVHAYKLNELWQTGRYVYDPDEYHGPTLYYLTFPSVWLSGASDWTQTTMATYRIIPVAFGVGLILLLLLVIDGLGRSAAISAGLLAAVSPAMVFYSRYYIQETLLVFFTFLVIAAGWRALRASTAFHKSHGYGETRELRRAAGVGWALLAGVGLGLMHATKETCIIAFGTLVGGVLLTVLWSRWVDVTGDDGHSRPPTLKCWATRAAIVAMLGAVFVSITLFSGFFTNLSGPLDSLRAYTTYFGRAAGQTHDQPWYYYLRMLLYTHHASGPVWSEALIVALSAIGIVAALRRKSIAGTQQAFLCFLAFYTLLLTGIYSVIPYKTPWCMLGFLHGMILLAGVGTVVIVRAVGGGSLRLAVVFMLLIAGVTHLGHQAWQSNTRFFTDPRNPYVYAHPLNDVVKLTAYLDQLARACPPDEPLIIKVMVPNCWPLPWYLRRFEHVGYWETVPAEPDADIIIASHTLQPELDQQLQNDYEIYYYGLRRDETVALYVRNDLRAVSGTTGILGEGEAPAEPRFGEGEASAEPRFREGEAPAEPRPEGNQTNGSAGASPSRWTPDVF